MAYKVRWLREAGFSEVDCLFKRYGFAVITGTRDLRSDPAHGRTIAVRQ